MIIKEISKQIDWLGKTLILKTGKIARHADGAVWAQYGDTVVLATVVTDKNSDKELEFFPLSVHYREMYSAAGKIPGGFVKREGKASEKETLISRVIDRSIRPLFPKNYRRETQIICNLLSYDPNCPPDTLAIIATSAALSISGLPISDTIAATHLSYENENVKYNSGPTNIDISSKLDMVVAGSKTFITMVEAELCNFSEDQTLDLIFSAQQKYIPVIDMIEELASEAGKEKIPYTTKEDTLKSKIQEKYKKDFQDSLFIEEKTRRNSTLLSLYKKIQNENPELEDKNLSETFHEIKSDLMRDMLIQQDKRIDGRKPNEIRQIESEINLLPTPHGSALFTRGETQALVTVTLGSTSDGQIVDGIANERKENFMLHYIFPSYSVGETSPPRAPSRREIGHGKLAWRAMQNVLPSKDDFPYTIRVISEITESNGSSSMATICGSTLALIDTGVPIKQMVAGIAMGLVKEGDKSIILSDITGEEDSLGDMDFKVAGTKDSITALQMDIKIAGINIEIMRKALSQAREGRIHILQKMEEVVTSPRDSLKAHAPQIVTKKINPDKIREVIGPNGKNVKELSTSYNSKIDIQDDGTVSIFGPNKSSVDEVLKRINNIIAEPKIGEIYRGKVVKILASAMFVRYLGNKEGYLHVKDISKDHIEDISAVFSENQEVTVKLKGFDNRKKAQLTMLMDSEPDKTVQISEKTDEAPKSEHKKKNIKKEQNGDSKNNSKVETKYFEYS